MSERPLPKDYSVLSPRQLNDELRGFYRALPRSTTADIEYEGETDIVTEILNDIRRRNRSDYKKRYLTNLAELLNQSPGTVAFRHYVLAVFNITSTHKLYGRHINSGEDDNQVAPLLDLDQPESGGIFDKERVKEIEQEVYRELIENNLAFVKGGPSGASEHSLQAKYEMLMNESAGLSVWGQEFLDLYGEEP